VGLNHGTVPLSSGNLKEYMGQEMCSVYKGVRLSSIAHGRCVRMADCGLADDREVIL
jgi:hypothetical protein